MKTNTLSAVSKGAFRLRNFSRPIFIGFKPATIAVRVSNSTLAKICCYIISINAFEIADFISKNVSSIANKLFLPVFRV